MQPSILTVLSRDDNTGYYNRRTVKGEHPNMLSLLGDLMRWPLVFWVPQIKGPYNFENCPRTGKVYAVLSVWFLGGRA